MLLGDYKEIKEGDTVKRTNRIISVPVGDELIGRVVNALGQPIDGKGPIASRQFSEIERLAPGVVDRSPVKEPMQTGLKAIDAMVPIGRGQRELIIGDRQTGKTAVAVDAIINQKGQNVICIYNAMGRSSRRSRRSCGRSKTPARWTTRSSFRLARRIRRRSSTSARIRPARWASISATAAVTRSASTTTFPSTRRRTAKSRCSSAVRQAAKPIPATCSTCTRACSSARRSCARSSGRIAHGAADHRDPGRRPLGLHSDQRDFDHRRADLPRIGFVPPGRPSGDQRRQLGLPRRGRRRSRRCARSRALRLDLAQHRELAAFAQFGSDLDKQTLSQLNRGRRLVEVLKQPQYQPLTVEKQVAIIFAAGNGYLDSVESTRCARSRRPSTSSSIHAVPRCSALSPRRSKHDDVKAALKGALDEFGKQFGAGRKPVAVPPRRMPSLLDIRRRVRAVKSTHSRSPRR